MIPELEKLWELADEQLEHNEKLRDEYEEEGHVQRSCYHDGWVDAIGWLIDIIEEVLDEEGENSDEW